MKVCKAVPSFLVLVLCFTSLCSQAQTQIDYFTEREGLSYRWVLDIIQDHRGFIWFGTYDGLNRFDGQDFVTYKHSDSDTNSISSSVVHHVAEDNQGGIWTYGSDLIFNRIDLASGVITKTDKYYKEGAPYAAPAANMRHFGPVANGDFIVLFQNKGSAGCSFWKYLPELNGFDHIITVPTDSATIHYFSERKDGKIWLWGMGLGYYLIDFVSGHVDYFPVYTNKTYSPSGVLMPIDQNKDLWYPWDSGVGDNEAQSGQLRKFHLPNDLDIHQLGNIRHDNAEGLWLNYGDSTLFRFDVKTESLEVFHDPFFGKSEEVSAMQRFYRDQEGAYWSGYFYGAARFENRPQLFSSYTFEALPGTDVRNAIFSARDMVQYGPDKIIARNENYAVFVIDVPTHQVRRLPRNPASGVVKMPKTGIRSMVLGTDGFLWTNQGDNLVKTDPETGIFTVFDGPGYEDDRNARIFQDVSENLWWCNPNKILRFDIKKLRMIPMDLEPTSGLDFIYASYDPLMDRIYGMYDRGIYIIDCQTQSASRLELFQANEGDFLTTAVLYWQDEFWLSTNKGLVQFNPETKQRHIYSRKDGLPSDIIYSAMGAENDLWLATHNGLCQFDPDQRKVTIYYQEEGLPHNEFNRWSYLKTNDGRMYFGGLNGIVGFDPEDFAAGEERTGYLNLIRFSKYNQKRDEIIDVVDNSYVRTGKIRINPYERTLSFQYVLSTFKDVSKNQYFHFLEGMEREWINNGNQNEARYIQVPPGKYTFRVKAMGPNGSRALNELAIPITVIPYWYLRWWAIMGYLVIAGSSVAGLYRFQLSRRMDRQEAERLRELEEVKSRMYTNITHEFRTPLTVMLGMNEAVKSYATQGDLGKVNESTEMIERNARNLLDLVNQMMDLSKLEAGMLDINNEHADILAYLRYRLEAFQSYAAEKKIHIDFQAEVKEILMDFDPDRMSHIINNLMSNAIKFTPENGSIYVSAAVLNQADLSFLEFKVRDTGIGIEPDKIDHIFDRFYQADSISMKKGEGTGIGLSLVQEMIKLLGGSIMVQSKPGEGSTFTVLLPITDRGILATPTEQTSKTSKIVYEGVNDPERISELPLVLIVEDNTDVAHYIEICIEHAYRTMRASDGQEGISKSIEHIPDVIISDVMMPGTDGLQLCASVKKDERTSHIPVILLTAKTDHDSKIEGLEHGADAYLSKPFDKKELLIRLRNLLSLRTEMQRRYAQTDYTQPSADRSNPQDTFIIKIRTIILAHLEDDDFDISLLCRQVHLSRAQLHRKLTAVTGQSASQLIRKVQLEQAIALLPNPDLSVSEVAYRAGFKTQAHFSRVFSDNFGISPSEYQRKLQN